MAGKEIGNYVIKERLNKGGTSFIYQSESKGEKTVCKIADGKYTDVLVKEYEFLRSLDHENVVKVFDCISCNKIVAMSMEMVPGGDLHDFIVSNWPVPPETRKRYASQVLSAVEFMHAREIAHCDLKLENLLISSYGDIKVIDFGSALKVSGATVEDFGYIATTPEYLPPEIICACVNSDYDIRAIDEWSVGVVLFILLTGRFPFGEVDHNNIAKYIKKMRSCTSFELRHKEENLIYFEREYLDMVRGLLNFSDEMRLPVAKVLHMPYFKSLSSSMEDLDIGLDDIDDEIDKEFGDIFADL